MNDPAEPFEQHRGMLLGLAYQLLGSMWDAEDIVQDAFVRWMRTDRSQVRQPRAFLITVITRLALDQLRSARVTREAYPGPWLPEPVSTGPGGPLEEAELRDSVSYATLQMMERLRPPERAVFVLREAFDLPYEDIAATVGASPAACRQLHHRARQRLESGRPRFRRAAAGHTELVERFLGAARSGDLDDLRALLARDVIAWNDGGGKARAALRPVQGREHVIRFIGGLVSKYSFEDIQLVEANGATAVWVVVGGQEQLVAFDIRDGLIHQIFGVLNPDKLAFVRP
ncbi:MAG: RNA polymerase sigma-70 factor [Micromonosporaceae bacterium]